MSAIQKELAETLLWLCSIESPIGDEKTICDQVSKRLERLSLASPIRRYSQSIVVPIWRGDSSAKTAGHKRPHVVLAGHLDTVRTENGPARIEGERIFGAGSSDMKSGLALMIVLAEQLLGSADQAGKTQTTSSIDLSLIFYAREEGPFTENELGPLLESDPEIATEATYVICLEPSDNKIALGCNGSIHATVTFTGKTGHSSRPWEGVNAITLAANLLTTLRDRKPDPRVLDGHTYRNVITVTQAKDGGRGRNVVPDSFTLNLNSRFTPDRTIEEAKQEIVDLVAGSGGVAFTDLSPGALPNANHLFTQTLIASGAKAAEPKQAWTDVARFSALGIPAINFGPGENAQAHQKNESTSLPLVYEGFEILSRWFASISK